MERLGVLARSVTSPQPEPTDCSPQRMSRSPRFPPEIFERISTHVDSPLELEALSLAGRVCLAGAQMVLYRNICYVIPAWEDWTTDLLTFLTEHSRVASYIRHFGLESHDLTQKAEVDLKIVTDILARLPGLVDFDMLCLTWTIPTSPPNLVQHPSLQILTMMGLDITDITHSPLRLLELRPRWRKVEIEYLDCIDPKMSNPGLPPVEAGQLTLTSYPFYVTDKVRPASYTSFTNVASLRAEYVTAHYADCLTRLVTSSADTLQSLHFTLNPYEPCESIFQHLERATRID
ncbi:hypothetical protein EIP86_004715 [Pleurotus ostreatoroseus]|nr:hypothetical protein EIP86_004715 [Pleurotus ostreatoroseus]